MHETEHSKMVLCDNPEAWGRAGREEGGGCRIAGHVHTWLTHVNVCKNHHNIVK